MVNVSVFSLIYKSTQYADHIWNQMIEFTPKFSDSWDAEFYFIANNPTDEVLSHLEKMGYDHHIMRTGEISDRQLFQMGIGCPAYMHRVYNGYNMGIRMAQGKIVVLLGSDICLSPDWLENLLKYLAPGTCITSMTVERDIKFPYAYHGDFGDHPIRYDQRGFLEAVKRIKYTGLGRQGAYMPLAVYKEDAIKVGMYPPGNIAGKTFDDIPTMCGDERFIFNLREAGIERYVALDSIVYHIKEGERDEIVSTDTTEGSR